MLQKNITLLFCSLYIVLAGCTISPAPVEKEASISSQEETIFSGTHNTVTNQDTDIVISREDYESGGFYEVHKFISPELGISLEYEVDDMLFSNNKIYRYGNLLCMSQHENLTIDSPIEDKIGCVQVLPSQEEYDFDEKNKVLTVIDEEKLYYKIQYNPYIVEYEAERSGYSFPVLTIKKI